MTHDEGLKLKECNDAVSRQEVLDMIKKNTFRLTFAEEQNCEGHVAWSAEAAYSDVLEGELLKLSPVAPQQKTGKWIKRGTEKIVYNGKEVEETWYKCSECGRIIYGIGCKPSKRIENYPYCHCGSRNITVEDKLPVESED